MRYIDVSEWQGDIDWAAAKDHIDGAILRAGYGAGHADRKFARNAAECDRLGIPCGAYWFSYAWTPEMAAAEAKALLEAVKPYRMELPLCFDFEYDSVAVAAREGGVTVTKALATAMARAFCEAVEAGGYYALFYANPDYLSRYFDADLPRRFGLWLAQWPGGAPDVAAPPRKCAMWQWTSAGTVPGVAGNVDVNEAYSDFAAIIRAAGINALGADQSLSLPQRGRVAPQGQVRENAGQGDAETEGSPSSVSAAPSHLPPLGEGIASPFADALAWARAAGILPDGLAPSDTPTLAAVAEMFYQFDKLP